MAKQAFFASRDWKSESVTNLQTNQLTWVGARDTCVSKNINCDNELSKSIPIDKRFLTNMYVDIKEAKLNRERLQENILSYS